MLYFIDLMALRATALLSRVMPVRTARVVVNVGLFAATLGGASLAKVLFSA